VTDALVCVSAIMTPQNVAYGTERLIVEALYHRRPVYVAFPADLVEHKVVSSARPLDPPISDPAILQSVTDAIIAAELVIDYNN
jgi:indolepyruvate decarboxylase